MRVSGTTTPKLTFRPLPALVHVACHSTANARDVPQLFASQETGRAIVIVAPNQRRLLVPLVTRTAAGHRSS
jgi:hypothetical protein